MNREVGGSAGILALLAVLVHTQYPPARESKATAGAAVEAAQKRDKASQSNDDSAREGPWIATRAFFHRGEPDFAPNGAAGKVHSPCSADLTPAGLRQHRWSLACLISPGGAPDYRQLRILMGLPDGSLVHFGTWSIVASIADPLHTRLPLFADRQIESIQRSLQADDWQLAAQWLPWSDRFDPSESDINERRRQRTLQREQEQMPGALVFRRFGSFNPSPDRDGQQILLVLLVPETPTGGIAGPPFFAAMHLATAFTEANHPELNKNRVGLLMPSFSGSFASLTVLARAWDCGSRYPIVGPVYGGTISSAGLAKAFTNSTGLEFRSGIASTEDYKEAFCTVLKRYGIKESEAAYLAEDETAYAQEFSRPEEGKAGPQEACELYGTIPRYVFPRDISHLRNVYQDETGGASPERSQQNPSGVNFSIKDPSRGEDSVPTFSDAQTPLSQSAVVASIIDEFRRKRTRLVYIAATNSLDSLFLARLVRREAPDTRVLTGNPDLLFVSAASRDPLNGTVALSTYPMFFEGDDWLTHCAEARERILFAGPDFEGLYNATQVLIEQIRASLPSKAGYRDRLRASHQLQNGQTHPGLWLLTLTATGFHPVDLLDEEEGNHQDHTKWFAGDAQATPGISEQPAFPTPSRGWFIAWGAISVFVLFAAFLVLRVNLTPKLRSPVWLALGCEPLLITTRLVVMTGAAFALSAMEWILFVPVWQSAFEPPHQWLLPVWIMGAAGSVLPLGAIAILWWRQRSRAVGVRSAFYLALIVLLWLIVVAAWAWSCTLNVGWKTQNSSWYRPVLLAIHPAALLFRYRALDLYSGASPALPFLALGFVGFNGFLLYLKRFTRAGLGRPCLDLGVFDKIPLNQHYLALNRQVVAPSQLRAAEWKKRMLLSAGALGVCVPVLQLNKYAASFEDPFYNVALACSVAMLLFSMTTTCYDLLLISKSLRQLLGLINFLPLNESFKRITRDLPHRPIWSQQLSKHLIARQMMMALHRRRLARGDAQGDADFDGFRDAVPAILGRGGRIEHPDAAFDAQAAEPAEGEERTLRSFLFARRAYEKLCARLATRIIVGDLRPLWTKGIDELKKEHAAASPAAQRDLDLCRCCSDFVAFQFSRYLIYAVSQVRLIAWCLSFALLMLMVTLNSYSPQAPQLIGRFLAILFIALGVIVVRIFAQLERDAVLSRIAGTQPGELSQDFWIQVSAMGVLPLIGAISHLFPSISGYLYSWLAPGVEALH